VLIGTGVKSIGNNCYFGPGCKIVGECTIGNNVLVVANSVVLTDVPDNTTIMGVPARIKLPGGRLRKMPWRTLDARKNGAPKDAAKTNGAKTNGAKSNGGKTNGATANPEPEPKPEPQQKINA
jgi:tetrahydrodipicolinate N-succinyltransferase